MAIAPEISIVPGERRRGAGPIDVPPRRGKQGASLAHAQRGGWSFGALAFCCIFAAIVWAARSTGVRQEPARQPPASPWMRIVQPIPLYDLPGLGVGDGPSDYRAWRARSGTGRLDVMTFGDFDGQNAFLRVAIAAPPTTTPQPFYASTARRAAFLGLAVDRSGVPDGVATRFGILSVADVVLSRKNRARACLAFRTQDPAVRISGLACGSDRRPFGRTELACALDRLDLLGGGAQTPLTLYFAKTELARGRGCAANDLAPAKERETWLDPGTALPKFRAGVAGRQARLPAERERRKL